MTSPDMTAVEQQALQAWSTSPALRQEFTSRETYVAFEKAQARGQVNVRTPIAVHVPALSLVDAGQDPAQAWAADPTLRAEFGTLENVDAYHRAAAAGRVNIIAHRSTRYDRTGAPALPSAPTTSRPADTGAHAGSLIEQQALVRQQNVGRVFAGLPPLPVP